MMKDWIRSMRPQHWIKSGFCLAALIFSGQAVDLAKWLELIPLFVGFCLLSSGGYLVNDAVNIEEDKKHPRKKNRPLAAGRLKRSWVVGFGVFLALLGVVILFYAYGLEVGLAKWTPWVGVAYYVFTVLYSLYVRRLPLLDVCFLGVGFLLRVTAGAVALGLVPTVWLLSCTYAIVLLIGFGKRKGELRVLENSHAVLGDTRSSLKGYTLGRLNVLIGFCGVIAGGLYLSYCMDRPDRIPFVISGVPVLVGLMAYIRLVWRSEMVDAPESLVFKSPVLLGAVIMWLFLIIAFTVYK